MKKYGLYAVMILWVLIAGRYLIKEQQTKAMSLGVVFENSADEGKWEELDTYIEGYGKYGVCYLTGEEKEELVKNVAGALGLVSPCHITSENGKDTYSTILTKDSINGQVTIKAITNEKRQEDSSIIATQYVYVKITIYNNVDCAGDYRELVEGMFDSMGIDGNVNVNLVGSIDGALNLSQKNELADKLLNKLEAEVVAENRGSETFTIYAYSGGVGDYINIGSSKVNVNIAISYDENKDRTDVYLASPVSSLDY